jgi:hypothetical protein
MGFGLPFFGSDPRFSRARTLFGKKIARFVRTVFAAG